MFGWILLKEQKFLWSCCVRELSRLSPLLFELSHWHNFYLPKMRKIWHLAARFLKLNCRFGDLLTKCIISKLGLWNAATNSDLISIQPLNQARMIKLFLPVLHFSDDSNKFSQVERLQGQPSHLKNLVIYRYPRMFKGFLLLCHYHKLVSPL